MPIKKKYRTISSKVFKQTPWSTFKHDVYLTAAGEEGRYYYLHSRGSVFVIPILPDGRIVLLRQYRYLFQRRDSYEFPAGGMLAKGPPSKSAHCELLEESGYVATHLTKVGKFCPLSGMTNEITHVFIATGLKQVESKRETTEVILVLRKSFMQIEDMITKNQIWDGQTIASWTLARPKIMKLLSKQS